MSSYFEDLDVWKKACELSVRLYGLLKNCRDYAIKDQILRSSVSIPSNIAEGSERKSKKDFKRFISFSLGSAAELRTQVYIAKQLEILPEKDSEEIIIELKTISKMLQALYRTLDWSFNKKL